VVEEVGANARRLVREARLGAADFVAGGFRAFFAFVAAEPDTFAFLMRNKDAVLPLALAELEEDLAGRLDDDVDPAFTAHAMLAVGLELGALMLTREPADVEHATAFASGLFRGLLR
jgi:hypothetical protein